MIAGLHRVNKALAAAGVVLLVAVAVLQWGGA